VFAGGGPAFDQANWMVGAAVLAETHTSPPQPRGCRNGCEGFVLTCALLLSERRRSASSALDGFIEQIAQAHGVTSAGLELLP